MSVEYDFHPVINQRTYDILRHFGWHEERHIDITEFDAEMRKRGLTLSNQQLDFFSEFSGLEINFTPSDYDFRFFSLDDVLNIGESTYIDRIYDGSFLLGELLIEIGLWEEESIYLSSDGKICGIQFIPLGRTPLEGINNMVNHVPKDYQYY